MVYKLAPKRKPSAYNRHVAREMKAGKTMKQAAASWKRKGSSTTKRKSSSKSKAKKNTRRKTNPMNIGGFSPAGIIKAAALYVGTSLIIGRAAPQVAAVPGGTEAAAGGIATAAGLPGKAFLALGAAKFVGGYLLRLVGLNGGSAGGSSYDY